MQDLVINSESSGKYRMENKGGREFLVTQMLPIQSDSVMNGLLYPANAVIESYPQLDNLPAPAGHPVFNGKSVSAFDPEGGSSFNVGAFVREPKVNGKNILTDLVVDMEVANRSNQGQEIIQRIKAGKSMGVSTGLKANVLNSKGKRGNKKYHGIVNQIKFDHVAILLSESPAGDNTYTLNSSEFFNQKPKGTIMREITIDTSNLSLDDHKFLELNSGDASSICNALKHDVTEQEASTVLENAGKAIVPAREYEDFLSNRDALKEFNSIKAGERKEQMDFVLSNSKMDETHLSELSTDALTSLVNSIAPKNKHIVNGKFEEPTLDALEGA